MGDPFRPPETFVARCADCKQEDLKRNMRTLYLKDRYAANPKVFCHLCYSCFDAWVEKLEIDV